MPLYIVTGVIIFLVGFYCGRIWVTKLDGKTIPLKTVCAVIFVLLVIILVMVSMKLSKSDSSSNNPLNTVPQTESVNPK